MNYDWLTTEIIPQIIAVKKVTTSGKLQ